VKVYCQTCREYILDSSDAFVPGGPYDGSMFVPPSMARYNVDHFAFQKWVTHGDLFCPRCSGLFILGTPRTGEILLTEHGLLESGIRCVDERVSIVNDDFSLQTVSEWNPGIAVDRAAEATAARDKEIDRIWREIEEGDADEDLLCPYCDHAPFKNKAGRASHMKTCAAKQAA